MATKRIDYTSIVKTFISNNESFKLVHYSRPLLSPLTTRLLILDSSFNPPHRGHLSMVQRSIVEIGRHDVNATTGTINNNSILLLFSVKNADKKDAISIENYNHRLNMIKLFSDYIEENLGVACGIAITNASLFVDKSDILHQWIEGERSNESISQYFLLGFDTVIRFFDMKYYTGQYKTIKEALDPFFAKSKICTFLRDDPSSKMSISAQKAYVSTHLWNEFSKEDIIVTSSENEWMISSSGIRKAVASSGKGDDDGLWRSQVTPAIAQYIDEENLY